MTGINLRVATLKNAKLKNCNLRGATLAGTDLEVSGAGPAGLSMKNTGSETLCSFISLSRISTAATRRFNLIKFIRLMTIIINILTFSYISFHSFSSSPFIKSMFYLKTSFSWLTNIVNYFRLDYGLFFKFKLIKKGRIHRKTH